LFNIDNVLNKYDTISNINSLNFISSVLSLFQISIENSIKTETILAYHLKWSPIDVEEIEYYRYEMHIENLKEILEEKKNAEEGAYKDQHKNMPNTKNFKPPKMPSIGNFKIPK
jgi:hypothetical protein